MSSFVAVKAAFELFVFGSRHDFIMADIWPFSQSRLSINIYLLQRWWRATLIFLLLFLMLKGRLKNLCFQERFRNVLLLLYLFWKSLDQEKGK